MRKILYSIWIIFLVSCNSSFEFKLKNYGNLSYSQKKLSKIDFTKGESFQADPYLKRSQVNSVVYFDSCEFHDTLRSFKISKKLFYSTDFLQSVTFYNCKFYKPVILRQSNFYKNVNFINCYFSDTVELSGSTFYEGLFFYDCHFSKSVFFNNVIIFKNFEFFKSHFEKELQLNRAKVYGNFNFLSGQLASLWAEYNEFLGHVNFSYVFFTNNLFFNNNFILQSFNFNNNKSHEAAFIEENKFFSEIKIIAFIVDSVCKMSNNFFIFEPKLDIKSPNLHIENKDLKKIFNNPQFK